MNSVKNRIMAHLIAGYPDMEKSLEIALLLAESGVSALEIQFPFSDPTADGPAIEKASMISLENGFRVDKGFELVRKAAEKTALPVFIMTYGSIAYARGVEKFAEDSASAGAEGVIVPDLPFDYDEGLYAACRRRSMNAVPVAVPSMEESRIEKIAAADSAYIYAALRSGTTGTATEIGMESITFLKKLGNSGKKVMAGFGLRNREQIKQLEGLADYFIVGSSVVNLISEINGRNREWAEGSCKIRTYIESLL